MTCYSWQNSLNDKGRRSECTGHPTLKQSRVPGCTLFHTVDHVGVHVGVAIAANSEIIPASTPPVTPLLFAAMLVSMTYHGPCPKEEMLLLCARIGFNPPA